MKLRAVLRSISWLSVSARSIGRLARGRSRLGSVHGAGLLARGPTDADAAGHLLALNVVRAAGMDGDDPVALLDLEEPGGRSPRGIGGERSGADRLQDCAGHPEAGGLAVVRELRALVRLRLARVREVEVAEAEEPGDLGLDVDVGEAVADVRLLAERRPVPLGLLAVAQQPVPHSIATDPAAPAVLELEVRRRDRPALVLAADQRECRDAHVVEEHRLLDSAVGPALAARAHQLHRLHVDAREIRVDHEPGEVLVAPAVRRRAGDQPDSVGAVVAADEDLLAVDHVVVAATRRGRHPHAGEIGAGAGLGQELPGAHLAAIDRRQERLSLLLRAPDEDGRRAGPAAAVVVRRQREVEAVDLLLENDGVIDVQAAAAVLRRGGRIEPALRAELPAEGAELEIAAVVVLGRHPRSLGGWWHVRLEPRADLAPESLPLLCVGDLEVPSV